MKPTQKSDSAFGKVGLVDDFCDLIFYIVVYIVDPWLFDLTKVKIIAEILNFLERHLGSRLRLRLCCGGDAILRF